MGISQFMFSRFSNSSTTENGITDFRGSSWFPYGWSLRC